MKFRFKLVILLLIPLCFSACKKEDTPIYEMDMFFDIDVPAGLNTIETHFFIIEDVPTFAAGLLSGNNLGPDDIGSILGATATFQTRFSGQNLDFIQDIGVHILDQEDHSIRREAFYIFNDLVPIGTKTDIMMLPSIVDFQNYLVEETVDIEFRINLRSFVPQVLDGRIQMKFFAYRPE